MVMRSMLMTTMMRRMWMTTRRTLYLDDDVEDDENIFDDHIEDDEQDLEAEALDEEESYSQDSEQGVELDELLYEELIALGEAVGTECRGLTMDVLTSLPYSTYKCQPTENDSFDQCVICRVDYEDGEELVVLPCKHPYHSECINKWLQINKVCPICGNEVSLPTLGRNI
ncbi:E3 ubiquitin ligase BIG BROTHER-related-like isoform X2 [Tasmannia lanceolata]